MQKIRVVSFTAAVVLATTTFVRAEDAAPEAAATTAVAEQSVGSSAMSMTAMRAALTRYDLGSHGTLERLQELSAYIAKTPTASDADEAAFLRAAVTSDLAFVAEFNDDAALRGQLASVFGVQPDALTPTLEAQFKAVAHGIYRGPALAGLAALAQHAQGAQTPLASAEHDTRSDARLLRWAAERMNEGPAFGRSWALLGHDACAGKAKCDAAHAGIDSSGRRVLDAMQQIGAAMQRLDRAAEGDPLVSALAEPLAQLRQKLVSVNVSLPPAVTDDQSLSLVSGPADAWPAPDCMLFVTGNDARIAFAQTAQLAADGSLASNIDQPNVFPASTKLLHLDAAPPFTRPLSEISSAVSDAKAKHPGLRVAIATAPDAPALMLGSVLMSLRKAGVSDAYALGRDEQGSARSAPLRIVLAGTSDAIPATELKLRVRLGGYSVNFGQGVIDVPRVKEESGWRFDVPALQAALQNKEPASAAVSFMPEVASENLLAAIFEIKTKNDAVDVVVQ